MSFLNRKDPGEELLDEAVAQIHTEDPDPRVVEEAAARVWRHLSAEAAAPAESTASAVSTAPAEVAVPASLRGCGDFQSLIPTYLRGELPPARALLVEDHTRSCVPCRRALREAREGIREARRGGKIVPSRAAAAPSPIGRAVWMSLAAALVLALGFGLFIAFQEMTADGSRMASIQSVDGALFLVEGETARLLEPGATVDEGDEVRTAKSSTAVLRMADGSLVEMAERSGLSFDAGRRGNTVELERGHVIVRAAKQREGNLFVRTSDALVSVTGTIFSVNNGTKGSRVSVIEGEVHVKQARGTDVLQPGRQVTTHASVRAVPIRQEIAWSRDAAFYEQVLAELTALGREIDAQVSRPGLRYGTELLELASEETTFYIALPNLAASLAETQEMLDARIAKSPTLQEWWSDAMGSGDGEEKFREMIRRLGDLGRDLGDEIVVTLALPGAISGDDSGNGSENDPEPLLMAQVLNESTFRASLEREIDQAMKGRTGGDEPLVIVDDLASIPDGEALLLWVGDGLFVATSSADRLRETLAIAGGAPNAFVGSRFHGRIAAEYRDGAGWVFAADLALVIPAEAAGDDPDEARIAEALGVYDLEHFVVNHRELEQGHSETRAALTFDQPRRGAAAWLSAPAPMGSLSFFSPDANLVAAFVVKSPVSILDELLSVSPEFAEDLAKVKAEHGFDLREDLAAPLGGELAMAVDGPVLPEPSWKLVVEVYDPARLQHSIERAVARLNDELREKGKSGVELTAETSGGRTYHRLSSQEPKFEAHYLYEDGYFLAGPSRALLERALQLRDSGVTLASAAKFRDLLGPDGQVNVSALVYQNLKPLADSASKLAPRSVTEGGPAGLGGMFFQGPTLLYAYAETDRIVFAGNHENSLGHNLGLLTTLGGFLGVVDDAHSEALREGMEDARQSS
jgi:hypothetical protein